MHRRLDLYTRWWQEMRRKNFFRAGQRVGVAVSGGPDSVLLLHFMKILASEVGFTLAAVHFNHRLRGAESDGDEALVRDLAASLQIEYLRRDADVGGVARERRGNLEAVARELRYRFFFSLIDHGRLEVVATAHTASDQAETVLLRLLRGTGTRGLGGIYPVLEGKVVRPFLSLTRAQVMQEIAARGIPYRVDSSNHNTGLRRNKVRAELLPLLAKEYNPQIVTLLNQLADRARDDEACLERMARERAQPWRVRDGREERIPATRSYGVAALPGAAGFAADDPDCAWLCARARARAYRTFAAICARSAERENPRSARRNHGSQRIFLAGCRPQRCSRPDQESFPTA